MDRKQRLVFRGVTYKWHSVNREGTTQGSVRLSGPHLFNLFINGLAIRDNELTSIVKYADDSTLLVKVCKNEVDLSQEVVNQFFSWTHDNAMSCNLKKCNELKLCKKVAHDIDPVKQHHASFLFKSVKGYLTKLNHRFNEHIKAKLQEANKCLYVIRCLRKEGYQQPDIDYFFTSIVLTKLTYGLPIYASSTPDLTVVQNFLQRCYKRKYVSYQINIYDVLEKTDRELFNKISSMPGHPLYPSLPKTKKFCAP